MDQFIKKTIGDRRPDVMYRQYEYVGESNDLISQKNIVSDKHIDANWELLKDRMLSCREKNCLFGDWIVHADSFNDKDYLIGTTSNIYNADQQGFAMEFSK